MNKCLICDENIEDSFNSLFMDANNVCYKCIKKFKTRNKKFVIDGVEGEIIYYYDDFFKDLLFRYKGTGDYPLKDAFFTHNFSRIKRKYRN